MQKEVELVKVDLILHVLQELLVVQVVVVEVKTLVQGIPIQVVLLIKHHQCLRLYSLLVLEMQEGLDNLVVNHLIQEEQVEVEELVVLEVLVLEVQLVDELVEQEKMFLLFLVVRLNLFILQMDQMLEHQLEVFLQEVVEEDKIQIKILDMGS